MTDASQTSGHPWLSVLASGSSGNCSVLVWEEGPERRAALIDLGLSPRRTRSLLAPMGLTLDDITSVFLTHLDSDHFNPGWMRRDLLRAPLRMHRRHLGRAAREGISTLRTEPFESEIRVGGLRASVALASHDELGVSTFRFGFETSPGELGFATDVGSVTPDLVEHLVGVDVLALESNYCPRLELASQRPEHLKQRIMGGSGHLSNQQSAAAARAIGPRSHLVLLHLSRECNRPVIALDHHAGIGCPVTVSTHAEPTAPIPIRATPGPRVPSRPVVRVGRQSMLFGSGAPA